MSQCDDVLAYMRKHGSITQMEATRHLGVLRLAARISDLRDRGHEIETENARGWNRNGGRTHFARYKLKEGAGEPLV